MGEWIDAGQSAPDFAMAADDGSIVQLGKLRGQTVVLYFYPKDDTPGCTKEACSFRDLHAELTAAGVVVLGVSPDTVASHQKFKGKYGLNFRLLADFDHKVAEKFGAWREKNMYGKKTVGVQRSTFLIDGHGKVQKVWKSVKVETHGQDVLKAVAALQTAQT